MNPSCAQSQKKTQKNGFTYAELTVTLALLAILVISVTVIVKMVSVGSVKNRKEFYVDQFASAVIEDLLLRGKEGYAAIVTDNKPQSYYDIFGVHDDVYEGITVFREVTQETGYKLVDITMKYSVGSQIVERSYHTRVNPGGLQNGGTASGFVFYYKQLEDGTFTIPPELNVCDPNFETYFGYAESVTVSALSNDGDNSFVSTVTDQAGAYTLKNILVGFGAPTDLYFFKNGCEPNAQEQNYEPAVYFFVDDNASGLFGGSGIEYPRDMSGLAVRQVVFNNVGEHVRVDPVYCAHAWRLYLRLQYNHRPDLDFQEHNYATPGSILVDGPSVAWGRWDRYQFPNTTFWDFSRSILSTDRTESSRDDGLGNPVKYNLVINNCRAGYEPGQVSMTGAMPPYERVSGHLNISVRRFNGSDPDEQVNIRWGTLAADFFPRVNPIIMPPFGIDNGHWGPNWTFAHIMAPAPKDSLFPSPSFPIGEHTELFHNTMNLVSTTTYNSSNLRLAEQHRCVLDRLGWITGQAFFDTGHTTPVTGNFHAWLSSDGHEEGTVNHAYTLNNLTNGNFAFYNVIDGDMDPPPNFGNTTFRRNLAVFGDDGATPTQYWGMVDWVQYAGDADVYTYDYGTESWSPSSPANDCPLNRETKVKITVFGPATVSGRVYKTTDPPFPSRWLLVFRSNSGGSTGTPMVDTGNDGYGTIAEYDIDDVNRCGGAGTWYGVLQSPDCPNYLDPNEGIIEADFDITVRGDSDGNGTYESLVNNAQVRVQQSVNGMGREDIHFQTHDGPTILTTGGAYGAGKIVDNGYLRLYRNGSADVPVAGNASIDIEVNKDTSFIRFYYIVPPAPYGAQTGEVPSAVRQVDRVTPPQTVPFEIYLDRAIDWEISFTVEVYDDNLSSPNPLNDSTIRIEDKDGTESHANVSTWTFNNRPLIGGMHGIINLWVEHPKFYLKNTPIPITKDDDGRTIVVHMSPGSSGG
ncbi:MAG: hypothetical protein GF384_02670 [Elusimicrobia bacterium]|nr:hypothetical protein [Elusimicrobiota bacterium]MBD3411861.1 hypothetical protein [Elusimicrobiota bacterium]